jgi:hypothetical protein
MVSFDPVTARPVNPTEHEDPLVHVDGEELEDSWEPPSPALGGPGQLVAAVVFAFIVAVILVAGIAALSWLFRPL